VIPRGTASKRRSLRVLPLLILLLAIAPPTRSNESEVLVVPLPAPGEIEWHPLTFRSIEQQTLYTLETDPDGRPAYRAVSECAASALVLDLPDDFDLARTPRLSWRWRIERGLEIDQDRERSKTGDDFAARVYVLFRFDPERASLWQRMQNRVGQRLFGREMPGQALNYVWSSSTPTGRFWTSPHHEDTRLLAVESRSNAPSSRAWREVTVDLAVDATRLFSPPPRLQPYALGLMTDADDVCKNAIAWFSDFHLLGPETTRSTTALAPSQ